MAKTTEIRGSIYGIGVEYSANLDQIIEALVASGIEVDSDSSLTNVYVRPENVGQAVAIINGLGYATDEDEDE